VSAIERLREPGCVGANVTMPYKRDVLALVEEMSLEAQRCGAASVIVHRDGVLHADNADAAAIETALRARAEQLRDGRVVILGAGGAAAATLLVLEGIPVDSVTVVARNRDRAHRLTERFAFPVQLAGFEELDHLVPSANLIVNATSIGMSRADDSSPVAAEDLRPGTLVYDLVYRRSSPTGLHRAALSAGAELCDGVAHMVLQLGPTTRLLYGIDPPAEVGLDAVVAAIGREPVSWVPLSESTSKDVRMTG
jgi:shikimate dehydrogenase